MGLSGSCRRPAYRPRYTHLPVGPFRCGRIGYQADATRSAHSVMDACDHKKVGSLNERRFTRGEIP